MVTQVPPPTGPWAGTTDATVETPDTAGAWAVPDEVLPAPPDATEEPRDCCRYGLGTERAGASALEVAPAALPATARPDSPAVAEDETRADRWWPELCSATPTTPPTSTTAAAIPPATRALFVPAPR